MFPVLFKEQPKEKAGTVASIFEPLKHGKSVALAVTDKRLPRKARVKDSPLLLLSPSEMYGAAPGKLICSLQAYGCEIIDLKEPLTTLLFSRLGLTASLATALADALNDVFHGGMKHGNKQQKGSTPGAARRSRTRPDKTRTDFNKWPGV